jgi:hypothetical protein
MKSTGYRNIGYRQRLGGTIPRLLPTGVLPEATTPFHDKDQPDRIVRFHRVSDGKRADPFGPVLATSTKQELVSRSAASFCAGARRPSRRNVGALTIGACMPRGSASARCPHPFSSGFRRLVGCSCSNGRPVRARMSVAGSTSSDRKVRDRIPQGWRPSLQFGRAWRRKMEYQWLTYRPSETVRTSACVRDRLRRRAPH